MGWKIEAKWVNLYVIYYHLELCDPVVVRDGRRNLARKDCVVKEGPGHAVRRRVFGHQLGLDVDNLSIDTMLTLKITKFKCFFDGKLTSFYKLLWILFDVVLAPTLVDLTDDHVCHVRVVLVKRMAPPAFDNRTSFSFMTWSKFSSKSLNINTCTSFYKKFCTKMKI